VEAVTLTFDNVLNYPGPVELVEGERLGFDVTGRPYAVVRTAYDEETDRTRVYLRRSSADDLARWAAERPGP